ncbi:MAG TPA: RNA-protein complex protein Nop10 [Methanoregulaceae archaeon]|nr:RNA-protein complex protein Nop10 [Methanolinea sp.]MCC7567764.1 RNA-protein complex protein Nop10 [Methanoregulaceae archaeon]MDD3091336.1 RNA-protein complex protein Nop10 [Methanoregulaceae archaeon]MDD5047953.1 RNA-protein complex protein Nop10 [Methanoregulaceae archaeon]MDD5684867.1 RNA-protein complex protein Nop10 [Methanoregulaceae archaeon]
MKGRIRRCPKDLSYTLDTVCRICGTSTVPAHPARFSPQDHYGRYRRIARSWTK